MANAVEGRQLWRGRRPYCEWCIVLEGGRERGSWSTAGGRERGRQPASAARMGRTSSYTRARAAAPTRGGLGTAAPRRRVAGRHTAQKCPSPPAGAKKRRGGTHTRGRHARGRQEAPHTEGARWERRGSVVRAMGGGEALP
eukprot:4783363-Prymnesium_polylepis.4